MATPGLADAKAYLRIDGDDEDALLDRLIGAATALCEAFVRAPLVIAERMESVRADGRWQRLARAPVHAIVAVEAEGVALPIAAYALDLDADGQGHVRASWQGEVRVRYLAGLASGWDEVPAPLKQGIVRLVAHLHLNRDAADEGAPPAAVAALWRPFRRVRL